MDSKFAKIVLTLLLEDIVFHSVSTIGTLALILSYVAQYSGEKFLNRDQKPGFHVFHVFYN